MTTER